MEEEKKTVVSRQNQILTPLQQKKIPVNIFLKTGIKIQGIILAFDSHVIILHSSNIHQMIFKHAISTIVPQL